MLGAHLVHLLVTGSSASSSSVSVRLFLFWLFSHSTEIPCNGVFLRKLNITHEASDGTIQYMEASRIGFLNHISFHIIIIEFVSESPTTECVIWREKKKVDRIHTNKEASRTGT